MGISEERLQGPVSTAGHPGGPQSRRQGEYAACLGREALLGALPSSRVWQ